MKLLLEVMLWIIGIPAAIILSIGLAAVAYIAIMYALYGYTACSTSEKCIYCGYKGQLMKMETLEPEESEGLEC